MTNEPTASRVSRRPVLARSLDILRSPADGRAAEVYVDRSSEVITISAGPPGEEPVFQMVLGHAAALRIAGQIVDGIGRDLEQAA